MEIPQTLALESQTDRLPVALREQRVTERQPDSDCTPALGLLVPVCATYASCNTSSNPPRPWGVLLEGPRRENVEQMLSHVKSQIKVRCCTGGITAQCYFNVYLSVLSAFACSFEVTVTSVSLPPFVSRRGLSNTNQRLSPSITTESVIADDIINDIIMTITMESLIADTCRPRPASPWRSRGRV